MDQVVQEQIICEVPFWKDPLVIFKNYNFRYCSACRNQIWNFIARLFVLAVVASFVFSVIGYGTVIIPVIVSLVTVFGSIILISNANSSNKKNPHTSAWKQLPSIQVIEPKTATVEEEDTLTPGEVEKQKDDAMKSLARQTQNWIESQAYARGYDQVDTNATDNQKPQKPLTNLEGFMNMNGNSSELPTSGIGAAPYEACTSIPDYAMPAARNPFMNILLDEYKYNPTRAAAAPVSDPLVRTTLDDFFRVQWYSDPTDVFGRNQNQRQFISQPVTSIPNDQKSYQEWLYKIPGKTCKEGGRTACLPGTDGGPVTWLNQEY
jgi:hypothetical protein